MYLNPFLAENLKLALMGKRVLLGITGSVAAFKAHDLIRGLRECGAEVRVVLTHSALQFVTPLSLEVLSGNRVATSLWSDDRDAPLGNHHIDLARWANFFLIAPATAHQIAQLAHGLAPDLLSTEWLAYQGPKAIAPAMNPAMWSNLATQANVATLRERGVSIYGPGSGWVSCGEVGDGRFMEPDELLQRVASQFSVRKNKKALVTLGPTRSYRDPVRYLTNRSSGKMGASLAFALTHAGWDVTVIAGPTSTPLPVTANVIRVETAAQMLAAAETHWPQCNLGVAAAAVLDFEFETTLTQKQKKSQTDHFDAFQGLGPLKLSPDILAYLGSAKQAHQRLLGFAAETEQLENYGREKRARKHCDWIFANAIQDGMETETNRGIFISQENKITPLGPASKPQLAQQLLTLIEDPAPCSS